MNNQPAQFGGLVIEMNKGHCHEMVKARHGIGGFAADEEYLQVQALEQDGKAVAAFPHLETGNWYCQPSWVKPNEWYLITVFPGAITRLIL